MVESSGLVQLRQFAISGDLTADRDMSRESETNMTAGVVATLDMAVPGFEQSISAIESRSDVEMGQAICSRLPLTIEASDAQGLELITNWLLNLNGIVHVDVVFVHYE